METTLRIQSLGSATFATQKLLSLAIGLWKGAHFDLCGQNEDRLRKVY